MTRVSENSASHSLQFALNKTKQKMEDLQLRGSTLKNISKPSDNPVSNVEALAINSSTNDNIQYLKNGDFALTYLNVTEKSLEELTDILTKAKEIAIAQSSDFFNADVRKNVATEIQQMYNQTLSIANRKVGLKHIFSGFNTLTVPFDSDGKYRGDEGKTTLEVSKNFFVPINLNGKEVFYSTDESSQSEHPLEHFEQYKKPGETQSAPEAKDPLQQARDLASEATGEEFKSRDNIFSQLRGLTTALENNDPKSIQALLEKFDNSITRLITLRTRVGSITNSINTTKMTIESENIDHASRRSTLLDADVAELFSDIQKQQAILKTTYQSSQGVLNQTLMDFLKR
ncbi:MAG: flagellar hook-associated protein FlgL [Bacteriovoracaceae bacterium]|nr:flagellar hook-associated protein FlgL [Bacteriovoracaceae bacterium]